MNISQNTRKTKVKVNQHVVKHLSLGLYRNFALAIKELISNAYDAGATEVKLKLDLEKGRIILRDNGRGMSEEEFTDDYLNIGFYKEPSKKLDELGRMRIGAFGIGFLAPLPYCKVLRLITKKRGQKFALEAEIPAKDFFTKGNWDISKVTIEYNIYESDLPLDEGETIIILKDIKKQIYDDLSRETRVRRTIEGRGYEKFKWTLAQYCPIEFHPDKNELANFFGMGERIPMKLWLDGFQLYRNAPENTQILEKEIRGFGNIQLKYVIQTPFKTVQPEEMRGLQVRLRDVAIGFPRDFDVTKLGRVLGKLNYLCGEVHILEGLTNSLLVNRDSFNFTEDVAEMYAFFRSRLTYWAKYLDDTARSDKELYLALGELREDKRIVDDLTESEIIHFSKERLRLSEGALRKSASKIIDNPVDKIVAALSKKVNDTQKIVRKKGTVNPEEPAIKYEDASQTITVFEDHPAFVETIEFEGNIFKVQYDEWDPLPTPYKICRLTEDRVTVIFNKSHPLFKSKLNDKIVKQLALGILMILGDIEDNETLIKKFNKLIEDVLVG